MRDGIGCPEPRKAVERRNVLAAGVNPWVKENTVELESRRTATHDRGTSPTRIVMVGVEQTFRDVSPLRGALDFGAAPRRLTPTARTCRRYAASRCSVLYEPSKYRHNRINPMAPSLVPTGHDRWGQAQWLLGPKLRQPTGVGHSHSHQILGLKLSQTTAQA